MGKIDMRIIYGKLYNSQTRTFLIRTGEKFIDETGPYNAQFGTLNFNESCNRNSTGHSNSRFV